MAGLVDVVKKFDLRPMAQMLEDTANRYMGPVTDAVGLTSSSQKADITPQSPPGTPAANREIWEAKGLPGRAKGGPVKKGKKYIVGEKGPEVFVPKKSGKVVPNNRMTTELSQLRQHAEGGAKKRTTKPRAKTKAKPPVAPEGAFPWSR